MDDHIISVEEFLKRRMTHDQDGKIYMYIVENIDVHMVLMNHKAWPVHNHISGVIVPELEFTTHMMDDDDFVVHTGSLDAMLQWIETMPVVDAWYIIRLKR